MTAPKVLDGQENQLFEEVLLVKAQNFIVFQPAFSRRQRFMCREINRARSG